MTNQDFSQLVKMGRRHGVFVSPVKGVRYTGMWAKLYHCKEKRTIITNIAIVGQRFVVAHPQSELFSHEKTIRIWSPTGELFDISY